MGARRPGVARRRSSSPRRTVRALLRRRRARRRRARRARRGPDRPVARVHRLSLLLLATLRRALQDRLQVGRAPWTPSWARRQCSSATSRPGGEAKAELRGVPGARAPRRASPCERASAAGRARRRPRALDPRRLTAPPLERTDHMEGISAALAIAIVLAAFVLFVVVKTAVVVPQQNAYVVERLGKFHTVAQRRLPPARAVHRRDPLPAHAEGAGDRHPRADLHHARQRAGRRRRRALPQGAQPERASYGITDYYFAIIQLAQTTLRSEIGKIDLDRTFEERTTINGAVVERARQGIGAWGVKVLRYEIKNISRPPTCSPRWRSRCAPSARSAPWSSPRRASATPRSTRPRARSSR